MAELEWRVVGLHLLVGCENVIFPLKGDLYLAASPRLKEISIFFLSASITKTRYKITSTLSAKQTTRKTNRTRNHQRLPPQPHYCTRKLDPFAHR